jgi:ABC-type sugar transport system ATPase subunit
MNDSAQCTARSHPNGQPADGALRPSMQKTRRRRVVDDVSLNVGPGEIVGLLN